MKKLLIASMAAALTAGVWAADAATYTKTQQGFENSSFDISDGLWSADDGVSGTVEVKTYEDGAAYTYGNPTANTAAFGGPGSSYLNLETDSGKMLRRNFAESTGAVTVDADNSYVVDTLVKFTATDEAPTVDTANGDKFILWLQSTENDSGTTYSLMATCGTIDEAGSVSSTSANIALNASVTADQWARVSVKTIKFYNDDDAMGTLGFVVYVDGVAVSASATDYAALFNSTPDPDTEMTAQGADYYSKQMVFPCLISGEATTGTPLALTSVGFEGTGAIDDLMIVASSDEDAPTFTAWTEPVVTTYTVSFQAVGLAEGASWSKDSETIESGKTLAQPEEPSVTGYTFKGWFSDEECANAITFPLTIEATQTIYAQFEAEAAVDPVAPGETVTGTTEAEATAALEKAGIKDPFTGITKEQKDAYAALFEATATETEDGSYTATWTLKSDAVTDLTNAADDALAATLNGVLDGEATVSITAQPGIYYTVLKSETLTAETYEVVEWAQATDAKLSLPVPTKGDATQCFYKIGVTAVKPTTGAE